MARKPLSRLGAFLHVEKPVFDRYYDSSSSLYPRAVIVNHGWQSVSHRLHFSMVTIRTTEVFDTWFNSLTHPGSH